MRSKKWEVRSRTFTKTYKMEDQILELKKRIENLEEAIAEMADTQKKLAGLLNEFLNRSVEKFTSIEQNLEYLNGNS